MGIEKSMHLIVVFAVEYYSEHHFEVIQNVHVTISRTESFHESEFLDEHIQPTSHVTNSAAPEISQMAPESICCVSILPCFFGETIGVIKHFRRKTTEVFVVAHSYGTEIR